MPVFMCTRCGRKIRAEYEVCRTGCEKCNMEKAPECCGKPMIEAIDD